MEINISEDKSTDYVKEKISYDKDGNFLCLDGSQCLNKEDSIIINVPQNARSFLILNALKVPHLPIHLAYVKFDLHATKLEKNMKFLNEHGICNSECMKILSEHSTLIIKELDCNSPVSILEMTNSICESLSLNIYKYLCEISFDNIPLNLVANLIEKINTPTLKKLHLKNLKKGISSDDEQRKDVLRILSSEYTNLAYLELENFLDDKINGELRNKNFPLLKELIVNYINFDIGCFIREIKSLEKLKVFHFSGEIVNLQGNISLRFVNISSGKTPIDLNLPAYTKNQIEKIQIGTLSEEGLIRTLKKCPKLDIIIISSTAYFKPSSMLKEGRERAKFREAIEINI